MMPSEILFSSISPLGFLLRCTCLPPGGKLAACSDRCVPAALTNLRRRSKTAQVLKLSRFGSDWPGQGTLPSLNQSLWPGDTAL